MKKTIRAYADVGSHGGIFYFDMGNIAERYPTLMQIYRKKICKGLTPVKITYETRRKK
jgi:hypothetical protein